MDGVDVAGFVGASSTLMLALAVWLRRRRKKGAPSFRPRARLRAYLSLRTHKRSEESPASLEPGPFGDDIDTGKHHRLPNADE